MKHPILSLITATLLLFGLAIAAEEKGKGGHGPDQMFTKMCTELSLTEEQKPKVKALLDEAAKKIAALKDLSADEKKKQSKEITKAQMEKVKALLTPDQVKKFDSVVAAEKKKKEGAEKSK